jgi:methionyl-tRNA formyltransferase
MNLIVFGEDSFTSIVVESLVKKGHNILGVFCPLYENKIHARLETTCNNYHISFKRVSEINSDSFYEQIREIQIDLIIICHFKKLISAKIINLPKLGCINLHPSLLPYYRGMSPQHFPIIKGESETGVTIHFVDEGIDTGDIILQKKIQINNQDYVSDLQNKMKAIYATIVVEAIDKIKTNKNEYFIQKHLEGSYFGKLKISDCIINKHFTCQQAYNLIRAVSFPYFGARYNNLIIWKAIKVDNNFIDNKIELGEISVFENSTYIKLMDGYLKLIKFEENEK